METQPDLSEFVQKASAGVVNLFEDDCNKQRARLNELLTKQKQQLTALDKENIKFKLMGNLQVEDMMLILKTCRTRLQTIKERMRKASTKAAKLKARSLKIEETKRTEALARELRREAQLTREQEMVAKSPSFGQDDGLATNSSQVRSSHSVL